MSSCESSSAELSQYAAIIDKSMLEKKRKRVSASSITNKTELIARLDQKRKSKVRRQQLIDLSRTRSKSSKSTSLFQKIQQNHVRKSKQKRKSKSKSAARSFKRSDIFYFEKTPRVSPLSSGSSSSLLSPARKGKRHSPNIRELLEQKERSTRTTLYTLGNVIDSSVTVSMNTPQNEALEEVNAQYQSILAERDRIKQRITEKTKALFANGGEEEKVSDDSDQKLSVPQSSDVSSNDNELNAMKDEKFGLEHEIIGELKAKIERLNDKLIEKEKEIGEKNEKIQRLSVQIRASEVKQEAIDTFKRKSVDLHSKLQFELGEKEEEIERLQQEVKKLWHQRDLIEERDMIIDNLQDSFKDVHEKNKNLKIKLKEKEITLKSEEFALSVKKKMIQEVEEEFDEMDITLVNMNHKNELLKEKVEEYRESLVECKQKNEELRHSNEDFVKKFAEMNEDSHKRQSVIKSKDGMLEMKNKLIGELEEDIEQMEEKINHLTAENKHLLKQIDSEKEVQNQDRMQLDDIGQQLADSQRYVSELRNELDEKERMVNNLCRKSKRNSKEMRKREARLSELEKSSKVSEQIMKKKMFDLKHAEKRQMQIIVDLKQKVRSKDEEMNVIKRKISDSDLIMDGLKKQLSKERKSHKKVMKKSNNALRADIAQLSKANGHHVNEIGKLKEIKAKYEELSEKRESCLITKTEKIEEMERAMGILSERSSKNDEDIHILKVQNEELLLQMNKQMEELKLRQTEIKLLRINEVEFRMKEGEIKDIRQKVQRLSKIKEEVNLLREENSALRQKLKNNECEVLRLRMKINENVLSYEDMKQGSMDIYESIEMFNEWMAKINRNLMHLRTVKESNRSAQSRHQQAEKTDVLVENLLEETRDLQQEMRRRLIANH